MKVRTYLSGIALVGALLVGGCATIPERTPYPPAQEAAYQACVKANSSDVHHALMWPLENYPPFDTQKNNIELRCQNNVLQADLTAMHAAAVGQEVK